MNFKVKKAYYRLFSVLLSVVMIVISVPISAVAQEPESTDLSLSENSAAIVFPESYLSTTTEKEQEAEAAKIALSATANNSQNAELLAAPPVTTDTLPEGVYAIRNVGNPTMYWDTWDDSPLPDRYMQQFEYPTNPAQTRYPNLAKGGLFKLEQYGTTNRYIIRLTTNNELTLGYSGNNVTTRNISTDQSEITYSETFLIEEKTPGKFYIRPNANSYVIAAPDSTASGGYTEESRLTRMLKSQSNDLALWEFCRYDGPVNSEVVIDSAPEEMVVPEMVTVSGHLSSTLIGFNGPVNYSVSETYDMVTDKATVSSSGELTAYAVGQIKLWVNVGSCTTYKIINIAENISGTYFFNNVEYDDKFMQIDNNANPTQNGAKMEIRAFEGSDDQRWDIDYISDGYYKITSEESGLTLTASTSANDAITQTLYTETNYQLWKFVKQSDGTYKISPKSNSSFYMAAGNAEFLSARNVETRTAQSDGKDEWRLVKIQYSATVYNFYDEGYFVRYNESETTSINKINSYMDEIANRYLELFGLEITMPSASYYESAIDTCKGTVNSGNIDTLCAHTNPHTILFYSTNSIADHFDNNTSPDGSNIVTKAYWSGHCIKTTEDKKSNEYNRCYSYGSSIFMIELSSIFVRDRDSKGILMHELNHQYGAKDHYHEILYDDNGNRYCRGGEICSDCGTNPRSEECIMNKQRIDISSRTVICPECKEDILSHLELHH